MTEALKDIHIHENPAEWADISTLFQRKPALKTTWGKFETFFAENQNLFPKDKFHHEKRTNPDGLPQESWDALFEEWLLLIAYTMVEKTLENFHFSYEDFEDNLASIKANQPNAPLRYAQLLIFHAKRGAEINRMELHHALWAFINQNFAPQQDRLTLHRQTTGKEAIEVLPLREVSEVLPFTPNPQGATNTDSKKLGVIFKMMALIALIIKLFSGIVEKWPDHLNPFADHFKYPSKTAKK